MARVIVIKDDITDSEIADGSSHLVRLTMELITETPGATRNAPPTVTVTNTVTSEILEISMPTMNALGYLLAANTTDFLSIVGPHFGIKNVKGTAVVRAWLRKNRPDLNVSERGKLSGEMHRIFENKLALDGSTISDAAPVTATDDSDSRPERTETDDVTA